MYAVMTLVALILFLWGSVRQAFAPTADSSTKTYSNTSLTILCERVIE
jgi:hypothetical protein